MTHYSPQTEWKETPRETALFSGWHVLGAVVCAALFFGAVVAASVTIQVSYESAALQRQQQTAMRQKQVLQEQLAEATSLRTVQAFVEREGFQESQQPVTSITRSVPVAQR